MKNHAFLTLAITSLFSLRASAQNVDTLKSSFLLTHEYYHFKRETSEEWHITSLQYKRTAGKGTFIGRINRGDRLGKVGWQAEAEGYRSFSKKVYIYAGAGYSPDVPVFPTFRSGASVYIALPAKWEVEGGYRHLYFDKHVWIGTAGLSKYVGAWLLNLRSFASAVDQSHFLTARHYFGKEGQYSWIQAGTGISPEDARNVQLKDRSNLSSNRISAGVNLLAGRRSMINASLGYSRDEYVNGKYGSQLFASLALGFRY